MTTNETQDTGTPAEVFRCICGWIGTASQMKHGRDISDEGYSVCPECGLDQGDAVPLPSPPAEVEALIEELERLDLRRGYTGVTSDELALRCLATLRTLTARIAELEGQVEDIPVLAKHQPCGCVVCTCEGDRCHGCGAKKCGTHPIGEIPNPVYLPTWQDQLTAAAKAERAKCVAELRALCNRHGADMYDRQYYEAAADHIEANWREGR